MENNKKIWMWVIIVIVAIIGLIFIMQKTGKPETSNEVNKPLDNSTNTTSDTAKTPVVKTTSSDSKTPNTATKNIVQLTSTGFKPFLLEITRGESVEFINASSDAMIIKSQTENPANAYPGFSQESGPLSKGGKYYFTFTTAGAWPYYNLNTITGAKDQGVIIVR